jgi:hypothetical protein
MACGISFSDALATPTEWLEMLDAYRAATHI